MSEKEIAKAILVSYKKANKSRRVKILAKYGYSNEAALLKDAKAVEKTKSSSTAKKTGKIAISSPKEKVTIHNVDILDATASMEGYKYDNSKAGIIKGLEDLQKDDTVNWTYSLIEMVESYKIKEHRLLGDLSTSIPFYGALGSNTPLYHTIYKSLSKLNGMIPKQDKVLIRIFTDGKDTFKSEAERIACKDLIHILNSENFTITFVATDDDLATIQHKLELDKTNTFAVTNSGAGFEKAFTVSNMARSTYATAVADGLDVSSGYFKDFNN